MQELGDHFYNIYLMQELHNKFLIKVHKAGDIPVMQVENGINILIKLFIWIEYLYMPVMQVER